MSFCHVVTGCSYGFGEALGKALIDRGDTVIGVCRSRPRLTGSRFIWIRCDFSSTSHIEPLVESHFKSCDLIRSVVLNAGVQERKHSQWSLDQMDRHLRVNCLGQVAMIEALEQHGRLMTPFTILNIASPADNGSPWAVAYAMSKAAMKAFLQSKRMSYDTGQQRPLVKTLYPGRMDTPGNPKRPISPNDPNPFRKPAEIVKYALLLLDEPFNGVQMIEIGAPIG